MYIVPETVAKQVGATPNKATARVSPQTKYFSETKWQNKDLLRRHFAETMAKKIYFVQIARQNETKQSLSGKQRWVF
jgi:hypothetical protein